MPELLETLRQVLPPAVTVALVLIALLVGDRLLIRRGNLAASALLPRQLTMLVATAVGLVIIVIALPVNDETQGQLLGLMGVLVSAVVALSATTFVSNAMAGLMLRSIRSFRAGDFIRVGDQFGRVTERGLFHTEIQTEDRDLETLPNLYLVTNPVRVVRASGTIVSANVSLGYDLAHDDLEALLVEAAKTAGLEEPFVQVLELGDFSVSYRAAGFLAEVKHLVTARSNLRRAMLDALHGAGVEIVSPTFMIQRPQPEPVRAIPPLRHRTPRSVPADTPAPEEIMFDKAEAAERQEQLERDRKALAEGIESLENEAKSAEGDRPAVERRLDEARRQVAAIDAELAERAAKAAESGAGTPPPGDDAS